MFRFKAVFGGRLWVRVFDNQQVEGAIKCAGHAAHGESALTPVARRDPCLNGELCNKASQDQHHRGGPFKSTIYLHVFSWKGLQHPFLNHRGGTKMCRALTTLRRSGTGNYDMHGNSRAYFALACCVVCLCQGSGLARCPGGLSTYLARDSHNGLTRARSACESVLFGQSCSPHAIVSTRHPEVPRFKLA